VYPAGENKETIHECAREWDERWVAGRILLLSLLGSLLLCNKIKNSGENTKREKKITINVPLFKKLRDIIFFCGTIIFWAISRDILRGPRLF
jgi:hypothetical protein